MLLMATTSVHGAEPLGFHGAVLQCRAVSVGHGAGPPLLRKLDLDIDTSTRLAILGPNGTGKTTLLATIAKQRQPLQGEVASEL